MSLPHWNYFLALEDDIDRISRYVELELPNLPTYSVEIARILMAAVQEIDVLLKQICTANSNAGVNEQAYRSFIPTVYPNLVMAEVEIARTSLSFKPFESWGSGNTPSWWTANNKVKHERHTHFQMASLEHMLNAQCGLLIANLYYHDAASTISDLFPGTKHLYPVDMIISSSPTYFGLVPNYKVL